MGYQRFAMGNRVVGRKAPPAKRSFVEVVLDVVLDEVEHYIPVVMAEHCFLRKDIFISIC